MTAATIRRTLPAVVQQHLDDAITQRMTRAVLVRAPHVRLHLLQRLDERLAASLDGLAVAGDAGRELCAAALANPDRGALFAATVAAIETRDLERLGALLSVAEAVPEARPGLVSAFGWVPAPSLRGLTKPLLDAAHPFHRDVGIAACALHHVDPGAVLDTAIAAGSAEAVAAAGKLGRSSSLQAILAGLAQDDPALRFASARSAWLLGEREASLPALLGLATKPGPFRLPALLCALKVLPPEQVHAVLKPLAQDPAALRVLIRGIGAAGDAHYVPWLIKQMADPKLTRLAGESFSLITGLDLAAIDFELKPPSGAVFGPNDDPADADVAMDEDDSLPWPDAEKIGAWWQAHGARFTPGVRHFIGATPSVGHCASVLQGGFQRHRAAAADYLCLLRPGTPLFNIAAPAWRQKRQLAQLGG
jgi:uncharacterized protein (TIGR02270 family)